MPRLFDLAPVALLAVLSLTLVGCSPRTADEQTSTAPPAPVSIDELEQDHAGHAHADSYAEAVAELDAMRAEIAAAFAAGDIAVADEPIHEVGHVLEDVSDLARKETLSDAAIAEIDAAVETLFDAFGRVDEKIHGGQGAEYSEVETQVDAAFATLRKHVAATP